MMPAPTRIEIAAGGFISVKDAMARTGLRETKLYSLMDAGEIAYLRAGRARRLSVVSLNHYIERNVVGVV